VTARRARCGLGPILAAVLLAACTETPAQTAAARDVEDGSRLARDAGAILLQFAAYDYGLAGALSGARTRTVTPARYGVVARSAARAISSYTASVVSAAVGRAGPIRDRLVPLADGLTDLGRDALAYADGGDSVAFGRVVGGVTAGWQRLRDLATTLPRDDVLEGTIARGTSFAVSATSATTFTVTAGPYSSAADAEQAQRAIGSPQNASVTRTTPFVVRLGGYPDAAAATSSSRRSRRRGSSLSRARSRRTPSRAAGRSPTSSCGASRHGSSRRWPARGGSRSPTTAPGS